MLNTRRPTHVIRSAGYGLEKAKQSWTGASVTGKAAITAALLLILVLLGRIVWGLIPAPRHPDQAAPVLVANVMSGDVEVTDQTIGTVVANATVQITPRIDGQVTAVHFTEGQLVKVGDLLFSIDRAPYEAALKQAQANLARDNAQLASAARTRNRYEFLAKEGAVSGQQRDQAVADAGALSGTVAADRAELELAELNLSYTEIRAPIDGKTGPILVYPGSQVRASASSNTSSVTSSASTLVVINQISPVKISFSLPQSDLPAIQRRMAAGRLQAVIRGANGGDVIATAPVDFTGNQVSATTGTVELRSSIPNADARLLPGELVQVTVALDTLKNTLTVPHEAVNLGPEGKYVYVVTADQKADMRAISVLHDDGTRAAIAGKIKPGDRVVTDGQLRLSPGVDVAIAGGKRGAKP